MIARLWKGVAASSDDAELYQRHLTANVFPSLAEIQGQRGGYVLRRENAGQIEFIVITLWDSWNAIRRFAGDDPVRAVVEPEAREVLTEWDDFVAHYEIAHSTKST
jgi:hypothetical protein